jgi:hypothetical protein
VTPGTSATGPAAARRLLPLLHLLDLLCVPLLQLLRLLLVPLFHSLRVRGARALSRLLLMLPILLLLEFLPILILPCA